MAHQCLKCGEIFSNEDPRVLTGCECGSRIFIYLKEPKKVEVSKRDSEYIEEHFSELARERPLSIDEEAIENIRIIEAGQYELNINSIAQGDPIVIRNSQGVYYVKLPTAFRVLGAKESRPKQR